MQRREFLESCAAGLAFGSAWQSFAGASAGSALRKPNILVIMSDEHTASITGCYGDAIVQTPHLDSLAANGILFENCYTASPLCVPARLAFTAGKYISRVGAWNNSCWLPSDDIPSLPRVLNDAGYETVLCGKMHYDPTRRYGFQVDAGIGNNTFKTGTGSRRKADDMGPNPPLLSGRFHDFRVCREAQENKTMAHDLQVTPWACEYLRNRRPGDRPYFMLAGYVSPHFPLIVPEAYWKNYSDKIPMPVIPDGFLDSMPLNYRHLRVGFQNKDVPPEIVKLGRELYYGFVQWTDEQIGMLLAALGDSIDADNTIVVYTTDHGENLGEHGLWWKNAMYESAARIPLIVSWPARWAGGQRRTGACSQLDLVRTIAEWAGAETPGDWDGDSLNAWLDDDGVRWKDMAVAQYYAHNIASGYVMIRSGKYKYVYHSAPDQDHSAEEELYDLETDPGEFRNLAKLPEQRARCAEMLARIVEEIGEHPDETEKRCRADYAAGYGRNAPPKAKAKDE
ncbi:MAG: Choline-sulfatase [candidate division BRC1 bacterium ADurb.BinA364]|nr:MAG: Choline-sulfatase [candidate division BRC1 bacterium ADurb.BinA364]